MILKPHSIGKHSPGQGTWLLVMLSLLFLSSCDYVKLMAHQGILLQQQILRPSQNTLQALVERDNFFIYGKVSGFTHYPGVTDFAVAAYSDRFKAHELVDINRISASENSYFGFYLPDGDFTVAVLADLDRDHRYGPREVIASRDLAVNGSTTPSRVLGQVDLVLSGETPPILPLMAAAPIPVEPAPAAERESLFYPAGTIRALDDPIFEKSQAALGVYAPEVFLKNAPRMFYTLRERVDYRIPVIFVHGYEGTPRDFEPIIQTLDLRRYDPWFFYYPSAKALDQLSDLFYQIFLSGKVIPTRDQNLIIVAHSMGGLIVRDAFNRLEPEARHSSNPIHFISIATPFAGHPMSAQGVAHSPIVLPVWQDLQPQGEFIRQLHRRSPGRSWEHFLIFAYGNEKRLKIGQNSDGVVPLSSQLSPGIQREAKGQIGFDANHANILHHPEALAHLGRLIAEVPPPVPEGHLSVLLQGGFQEIADDPQYSRLEKYLLENYGCYYRALAAGALPPITVEQSRFVAAARGTTPPASDFERLWPKFVKDYPALANPATSSERCSAIAHTTSP